MPPIKEMVSARKILWHGDRVAAWLRAEPFFPATLELGLTTACNLTCPDCPSRLGRPGLYLSPTTARRLFDLCHGRTLGVILTGGEPTLHPGFGAILGSAREFGFREIAVISNGTRLDRDEVAGPLLRWASAVRVSLYDLAEAGTAGMEPTLRRIRKLRDEINASGSALQIGTSLLTRGMTLGNLRKTAAVVRAAGAHWLYLHPTCMAAAQGSERAAGQEEVPLAMAALRREQDPGFAVHYLADRYSSTPITFQGYHAAHFIMVVGADGVNYLSSETKYRPGYRIDDEGAYSQGSFFSRSERRARIAAIGSSGYAAGGGRNRGVLYNHVLEEAKAAIPEDAVPEVGDFFLPHIL